MTLPVNDLLLRLRGESDGSAAPPAFIIDIAAGAILAANASGWDVWGVDPAAVMSAPGIDRAMPALHRLAGIRDSSCDDVLTFWAARGLLQLYCHIELLPPSGGTTFLVRAARCNADPGESMASLPRPAFGEAGAQMPAAARLAHEVRTPLSAVIAFAEALKDEHFGPLASARYRDYARNIYDSARHALSVADGILGGNAADTAPLPELAFRDLDPASVIESCLAVAQPLAERAGLAVVADLGPGTPRIIADEVSLKQMLLNLITNAIKFARPGDRLTVGAAYEVDGPLRINVADTGPGMGRGECARGGAPDAGRARRHDAGLGIGLPLTRALAEANGAALTVDSVPGRGTRVTITFGKDRVVPV